METELGLLQMNVWTPQGNNIQVEIDIKLAELDRILIDSFADMAARNRELVSAIREKEDLQDCINRLKFGVKIVSIVEFSIMKRQLDGILQFENMCNEDIASIEKKQDIIREKIDYYVSLRERSETKILRFR